MAPKKDDEVKDEGKIPAGSPLPPEKTETEDDETPKTVKVGEKEYESPEALAEAYQNLEGKLGEQGSELGTLRAANKTLTEQIDAERQAKETTEKETATDYESQLKDIYTQLNAGDLSVEDAMQQSNALTAEAAAARAAEESTEKFETILQDRDAKAIQQKFLEDNPDFEEIRNSGKLEPFKKASGGMHDDFSAYFAFKATTAHEAGKQEAAKLAAGDEKTKTVLTKPGESIQQTNKPKTPLSEGETEASMLAALKGGAG